MKTCLIFLCLLMAGTASAQYLPGEVTLPYESQRAKVMQRIGLTDMEVSYCRPSVKGRKIWGELVPFDSGKPIPWRGGANENTTVSFSTDVTVEGKPLPAGTYGLHIIPSATEWTFIFSKNSTSWGSFSYKVEEDALRVTAKPRTAEFVENLKYEFADPQEDKVRMDLIWEKVACGVTIGVDNKKIVVESMRRELRNNHGFNWVGPNSAAWYCFTNDVNLEEGLKWADQSVNGEPRFENLDTNGQILKRLGRTREGDSVLMASFQKATPQQLYSHGRSLLAEKKIDEAMQVFEVNMKNNPDKWVSYAGMARGYEAKGDKSKALASMKKAKELAPENARPAIVKVIEDWEKQ